MSNDEWAKAHGQDVDYMHRLERGEHLNEDFLSGLAEKPAFKVVDPDKEELELTDRIFDAIYLKYIDSSRFAENNIKEDILKAVKHS